VSIQLRLFLELYLLDRSLFLVARRGGLLLLCLHVQSTVINLSLAEIFEFPRREIALQLFNFILFGLHVKYALLRGELSAAGPVGCFVAEAHAVGFDRELGVQILLAVVEFDQSLVFRFFLRLGDFFLDLEAAGDLGLDLRVGAPVGAPDGGLHVSALLDDVEGLLDDGGLLEVSNVVRCDSLLVPQVLQHSLVLLLSHLLGLDLTHPAVVGSRGLHVAGTKLTVTLVRDVALVEIYNNYEINNMVTSLHRFVSIRSVDIVDRPHNDLIGLTVCSLLRVDSQVRVLLINIESLVNSFVLSLLSLLILHFCFKIIISQLLIVQLIK